MGQAENRKQVARVRRRKKGSKGELSGFYTENVSRECLTFRAQ